MTPSGNLSASIVQSMEFEYGMLKQAVLNTFQLRNTPIPREIPLALTAQYAAQKQIQWAAFLRKNRIEKAPSEFVEVIQLLTNFFTPVINSSHNIQDIHWLSAQVVWEE